MAPPEGSPPLPLLSPDFPPPRIAREEKDNNNDNDADTSSRKPGLFLRWSRLVKTVHVKDSNAGLLRGSIATAPPSSSRTSTTILKTRRSNGSSLATTAPTSKVILNGVSGCAAPSQVLCMMGPSGSGKTSLLNVISGRTSYDSGTITIDGKRLSSPASSSSSSNATSNNNNNNNNNNATVTTSRKKRLMAQIAYVKQADIFFTHLTVRDQLGYTAFLRLPQAWSPHRKLEEVDRIIQLLKLTKVADSKIDTLSGGEKKRVNIGTELLTDPSCILLDEPTR